MEEVELTGDERVTEEVYRKLTGRMVMLECFHILWEQDRLTCAWEVDREARVLRVPREAVLAAGTVDGLHCLLETEAAILNVTG